MRQQINIEYAGDGAAAVQRIDTVWLEVNSADAHANAVTAGSVGGVAADEGKVWVKVSETKLADGFTIDPDLAEADYLAYLATLPQADAADPAPA